MFIIDNIIISPLNRRIALRGDVDDNEILRPTTAKKQQHKNSNNTYLSGNSTNSLTHLQHLYGSVYLEGAPRKIQAKVNNQAVTQYTAPRPIAWRLSREVNCLPLVLAAPFSQLHRVVGQRPEGGIAPQETACRAVFPILTTVRWNIKHQCTAGNIEWPLRIRPPCTRR